MHLPSLISHPSSRIERCFATAALLTAVALATACGGGGDSPTALVDPPTTVPKTPDPIAKGTLVVTLNGLPAGASGNIVVTGPAGFSRVIDASSALVDLAAGRYTVAPKAVRTTEGVFDATIAEQQIDVVGGSPPSLVTVSYAPAPSYVEVQVEGLPTGANAAIVLSPSTGAAVNVNSTVRVSGTSVRWILSAAEVKSSGFTYSPTPSASDSTVLPGDTLRFTVRYAVSTGAVAVAVSGLPANSGAVFTVRGASGIEHTVSANSTLTDLEPGTYTVQAPTVTIGSTQYRPAPTNQQISVSASVVATPVVISYKTVTGSLVLSLSGAPSGALDIVRVSGPAGYQRTLNSSTVLDSLLPGTYTLVAGDIVKPEATWRTASPVLQRAVVGDARDSVEISYAVVTGSLALTVSGLPVGANSNVVITGPGGFARAMSANATLAGLAPGVYNISASSVTVGGNSYIGTPASQSVNIAASLVASPAVVHYQPRAAAMLVVVDGAPSGSTDMVRVLGPNGFDRTLTTTTALEGLVAGSYSITASEIVQPTAIYRASPATIQRTLALDQRDTSYVRYVIASGMIAVTVSGLPNGVNGNMQLSGPGGYFAPVTGTSTFTRLTPGTYGLSATNVSSGGATYLPSPSIQQIVVAASPTAAGATVTYNGGSTSNATLVITVSGAPSGGSPSVQISGPSGYSRTVTSSTTISALAAGSYNVTASSFNFNGSSYAPTPQSTQRTLTSSGRDSVGVTYSVSTAPTGQLAVTVSGLPSGTNAAIVLSGNGSTRNITGSTTVTGLGAGSYSLTASTVSNGSTDYDPAPANQSVTISGGVTSSATVAYTAGAAPPPPSGDDLSVEFAYVTQSVQRPDGSVPVVAGRDALVRVFVKNSRSNLLRPDVRLRVYDGAALLQTITIPAPELSVRTSLDEGTLSSTWNSVIAASNVRTGLRILADVDPSNGVSTDANRANNIWPRNSAPFAVTANVAPPFNVRFVPVTVGALTGNVTTANVGQFLTRSRLLHPLSTINADVRLPFVSSAADLQASDGNSAWLTVLSEMNALRSTDNAPATTHYYGVVKVTYNSGVAGYGYVPGRAAVGWDYMPSGGDVAAHEWGHNFSRPHSPCGVSGDPSYPYAGATIGFYGWNSTSNSLIAPNATDYMSYCGNNWTSDWSWSKVMNYRESSGSVANAAVAQSDVNSAGGVSGSSASNDGLLVWGRVSKGRVQLEPAFRVNAAPTPRALGAQFRLEALDASGSTILDVPIDAPLVDHVADGSERQFAVVIPWTAAMEANLASLRVRDARSPLSASVRTSSAAIRASNKATAAQASDAAPRAARVRAELAEPTARVDRAGGRDRLSWNNTAYPLAIVRDVGTGQTIAFLRQSGNAFISSGRPVDVTFSDGVRTLTKRVQSGGQPQ